MRTTGSSYLRSISTPFSTHVLITLRACASDDWVYMAHAVKGALGEDGYPGFLAWSQKSDKHHNEETVRALWDSVEPDRIGAGTLHHLAVEAGWRPASSYPNDDDDNDDIARDVRVDDGAWDEATMPRRPWVAPGFTMRGAVTVVAGPPSVMKSVLMLAWGCATALEKPHGRFEPAETETVVIYNVEDCADEQRRRLSAVLRQFEATPADISGSLVRVGPTGIGTLFRRNEKGAFVPMPAMQRLRQIVAERKPAMLICDPLVELHDAEENENTALREIIAEFRALAVRFNIAVVLVHHTRKGSATPGDPEAARGASSIAGAGRVVLTMMTMLEEDAEALGIPKDRKSRSRFLRLDDAKQNYAAIGDARWYEAVVYTLDNDEAVAAPVPWEAPDMWATIPTSIARTIVDEIEGGIGGGQRYSAASSATDRAAWRVVQRHAPSPTRRRWGWRAATRVLSRDRARGARRCPSATRRPSPAGSSPARRRGER